MFQQNLIIQDKEEKSESALVGEPKLHENINIGKGEKNNFNSIKSDNTEVYSVVKNFYKKVNLTFFKAQKILKNKIF